MTPQCPGRATSSWVGTVLPSSECVMLCHVDVEDYAQHRKHQYWLQESCLLLHTGARPLCTVAPLSAKDTLELQDAYR